MAYSDQTGAAAVEYALMIAAIAGVIIVVAYQLGLRSIAGMQTLSELWP